MTAAAITTADTPARKRGYGSMSRDRRWALRWSYFFLTVFAIFFRRLANQRNCFYCHNPVDSRIARFVHDAHSPATKFVEDLVSPEALTAAIFHKLPGIRAGSRGHTGAEYSPILIVVSKGMPLQVTDVCPLWTFGPLEQANRGNSPSFAPYSVGYEIRSRGLRHTTDGPG